MIPLNSIRFSCGLALACALPLSLSAAASTPGPQFWQRITMPTVAEAAKAFPQPPKEYTAIYWATGYPQPKDRIISDIEHLDANGGGVYMINSGGRTAKYLSPEYFALMDVSMSELKRRGLKMWIDGDDGYPDGMAGGMISKLYPQLGMQSMVADATFTVKAGETLSISVPVDVLGVFANRQPAPVAAPARRAPPAPTPAAGGAAASAPSGAAGAGRAGARAGGARASRTAQPELVAKPRLMLPLPSDGQFKWIGASGGIWDVTFQGSVGEARYYVASGQTLSIPLPEGTKSIQADIRLGWRAGQGDRAGLPPLPPTTQLSLPAAGQRFSWTAPADGTWEVTFVRHVFRSSPTRYGEREDGTRDKDSLYSLIDYLNPEATAAYIKLVPEVYAQHYGADMGTTILGFRGDETDFTSIIPWTGKLLETFQQRKGYDLRPYIAQFFGTPLSPEAKRAQADYFDVWSAMFRDGFYKPMQEWCEAHGMGYMMHLNHEELMLNRNWGGEDMTKNEGSFFRDMRYVGVPGVDNLSQIAPGIVADFPKLAGSAAHLFGRPQAWTESGGTIASGGKFVVDYQLVRGINFMNIRGLNNATPPASAADGTTATGRYISRSQYLLSVGRPAAQVALYHASDSYWLDDHAADEANVKLTTQLMEAQIDFDHIDHDSLGSICTLEGGGLKNLSGQVYRAVIVPTSTVIEKNVLDRLRAFAAAGGKVIFIGRTPTMVVDRSFLNATGAPDLSFATLLEPATELTPRVIAALPKPDVKLDSACAPLKYIHRNLQDGDVYFFFNESDQPQTRTATLDGRGQVQVWDPTEGKIQAAANVPAATGSIAVPLTLAPHESRFIVIGPSV